MSYCVSVDRPDVFFYYHLFFHHVVGAPSTPHDDTMHTQNRFSPPPPLENNNGDASGVIITVNFIIFHRNVDGASFECLFFRFRFADTPKHPIESGNEFIWRHVYYTKSRRRCLSIGWSRALRAGMRVGESEKVNEKWDVKKCNTLIACINLFWLIAGDERYSVLLPLLLHLAVGPLAVEHISPSLSLYPSRVENKRKSFTKRTKKKNDMGKNVGKYITTIFIRIFFPRWQTPGSSNVFAWSVPNGASISIFNAKIAHLAHTEYASFPTYCLSFFSRESWPFPSACQKCQSEFVNFRFSPATETTMKRKLKQ